MNHLPLARIGGKVIDRFSKFQWFHKIVHPSSPLSATDPHLLAQLTEEAPGVDIITRRETRYAPDLLEDGEMDLCIGPAGAFTQPGLRTQRLFSDRFICIVRADHPVLDEENSTSAPTARFSTLSPLPWGSRASSWTSASPSAGTADE